MMPRVLSVLAATVFATGMSAPSTGDGRGAGGQEELPQARFDGKRYENPQVPSHNFSEIWNHLWSSGGPWPSWVDSAPGPRPPERIAGGRLRITWVNHATLLVQMDGMNILTDPVWSRTAGRWGMGPKRVHAPGIRFEDLPSIDLVLLSHNHYDHMDVTTLERLAKDHRCAFVVPARNGSFLRRHGLARVREMSWWEEWEVAPGLRVKALPSRHWSQRGIRDRNKTLWCSYAIQGDSGNVFFAGDTGFGSHLARIGEACGPFRAALLPIGSYLPRAFMSASHIDPEEAVKAVELLRARTLVPMHYGTFRDGEESYEDPLRDLAKALEARPDLRERARVLNMGEGTDLP